MLGAISKSNHKYLDRILDVFDLMRVFWSSHYDGNPFIK